MKRLRILLPLTLLTIFSFGCREDIDLTNVNVTQTPPPVTEGSFSISGRVTTNNGTPIAGITVEIVALGLVGVTDEEGEYRFTNVPRVADGSTLNFTGGFFQPASRFLLVKNGSEQFLDVVMLRIPTVGDVNGATGGEILVDVPTFSTASISIPPGAARVNGLPYTGNIEVSFDYRDPENPKALYQSGNNIPALDPVRPKAVLESYGLSRLVFTGDESQPVTFDSVGVTLTLPFPNFLNGERRDSLFPWQLAPVGWQRLPESSERSFDSDNLVLEVFSSGVFNWAIPYSSTTVAGRLLNESGVPQPFINFYVGIDDAGIVYSARTGIDGSFCAAAPQDQPLEINYNRPCDEGVIFSLFVDEIGPFSTPGDLGDVAKPLFSRAYGALSGFCGNEINQTDDLILYVDGEPRGELILNADGSVSALANDCDNDGLLYLQTVQASNNFITSGLQIRNVNDPEAVIFFACTELQEEESLNIEFGGIDSVATEGSFLLIRGENEEFRQRLSWVGSNPEVSGEFTFTLTLPYPGMGNNPVSEATVDLREFPDDEPGFVYRCTGNCETLVVNVDSETSDSSLLTGSFSYAAEKINLLTNEVIATDIPVSGAFSILR